MKLISKYIETIETREGVSNAGKKWRFVTILTETADKYPVKCVLQLWNDTAEAVKQMRVGNEYTFTIKPESKENNGKWYTNIRCEAVE
jgi:hypothetical protein